MSTQIDKDISELANLCGSDKELFADVADFIANRLMLVNQAEGVQRLRTTDELRPYMLKLIEASTNHNADKQARPEEKHIHINVPAKYFEGININNNIMSGEDTLKVLSRCAEQQSEGIPFEEHLDLMDAIFNPDRAIKDPIRKKG